MFEKADFDHNLIPANSVFVLNISSKVNSDLRINERIFNSSLASDKAKNFVNTKRSQGDQQS